MHPHLLNRLQCRQQAGDCRDGGLLEGQALCPAAGHLHILHGTLQLVVQSLRAAIDQGLDNPEQSAALARRQQGSGSDSKDVDAAGLLEGKHLALQPKTSAAAAVATCSVTAHSAHLAEVGLRDLVPALPASKAGCRVDLAAQLCSG